MSKRNFMISVPQEVADLLNKEKNKSRVLWTAYLQSKGLILETKTVVKSNGEKPITEVSA